MPLFDKHNLNLAGEYRVAAELLLRGLHASITFGNMKLSITHKFPVSPFAGRG